MRQFTMTLMCCGLILALFPTMVCAGSLEKEMHDHLSQSLGIVEKMIAGETSAAGWQQIGQIAEEIRILHLLLSDIYENRQTRVDAIGNDGARRHGTYRQEYQNTLDEYLEILDDIPEEGLPDQDNLENLRQLLKKALPQKETFPVYGLTPYRHAGYPANAPAELTGLTPAYLGGDGSVNTEDTQASPIAPVNTTMADLAKSLEWDPVEIYQWIKNNVETEWYWGCMKGAEETLRQKSGNSCDQAALLVALLRASGYPARYIRGVVSFFPDIAAGQKILGMEEPAELVQFFQHAGIPHSFELSGQSMTNFTFEHIWVEAYIPYANYRGALADEHGKIWLPMDTSIKTGMTTRAGDPALAQLDLPAIARDYMTSVHDSSPLEYLQSVIDAELPRIQSGLMYEDLLTLHTRPDETLQIIPANLQLTAHQITGEYTQLPEELLHTVRFAATGADSQTFFDESMPLARLSNQKIVLSFEPATTEDQEMINSYGGLDMTPAYLVSLRPVILVDGRRAIVGRGGDAMGESFDLSLTVKGPNGRQTITNSHILGNQSLIAIVAQQPVAADEMDPEDKRSADLLFDTAVDYIQSWNSAENELAALLGLAICRPTPTIVTLGGVQAVTRLFETPQDVEWRGVYVDADMRTVEIVGDTELIDDTDPKTLFMNLSAMQGSFLEQQVLEDQFAVGGVSTIRLLAAAAEQGIALNTIDRDNADTILPGLNLADNLEDDILNAVGQGMAVTIPGQTMTIEDWSGTGYIKTNPDTGEAGYMLSGMIAGGMTCWGADRWEAYFLNRMEYSFSGAVNNEPSAAVDISKIAATDMQLGVVGEPLARPLQAVVRDSIGNPVKGATVIFSVLAGEGTFANEKNSFQTITNAIGVASALYICGTRTDVNSAYWWEDNYTYIQQVGENIVNVELPDADTELKVPFTAYAFPGEPVRLDVSYSGGRSMLTWAGTFLVRVLDQYDNSRANENVRFEMGPPELYELCQRPSPEIREGYLFASDDPCMDGPGYPLYGECQSYGRSINAVSADIGAIVHIMGGAIPGINRETTISCKNISTSIWTHNAVFGNCDNLSPPAIALFAQKKDHKDIQGNVIQAAPPGTPIEMSALVGFMREGEEIIPDNCGTLDCDLLLGNREFYLDTEFDSVNVTFGGQSSTYLGNGDFSINYMVHAGVNHADIVATASVTGRQNENYCHEGCTISSFAAEDTITISNIVYGVEVESETNNIEVAIDGLGQSTCDVPIKYEIQPLEYTAGSAYCYLYKKPEGEEDEKKEVIASIPCEKQGEGFATFAQGFQFDEAYEYTAEIVLNSGSQFEIRSAPIELVPGAVKIEAINLIDENSLGKRIPCGGSRKLEAQISPSNHKVVWRIRHKEKDVHARIKDIGNNQAIIMVDEDSEDGWCTIRAEDENNDCVYKEARLFLGCGSQSCAGGQCDALPGGGFVNLSSINIGIGLGPGKNSTGQTVGHLFIRATKPSSIIYKPEGLVLSTTSNDLEPIYDEDDMDLLLQVMAPTTLAVIEALSSKSYSISFYRPEDVVGRGKSGYLLASNAEPFVVWTLSPYKTNGLTVDEYRYGKKREHIYEYDGVKKTWLLKKANNLQLISITETESEEEDETEITETIANSSGSVASKIVTSSHAFDWGEATVEKITDPDGEALSTKTEYYNDAQNPGSYGRIAKRINPDGSWVKYEYDEQGRKTARITPWLDSSVDAGNSEAKVFYYNYDPVDPDDSNDIGDAHLPRTVTETILGQTVSKTYHAYIIDADGERTEITQRCARPDAAYGDTDNMTTYTTYYASNTGLPESGRLNNVIYPDGRMDVYSYGTGTYSYPSTDDDPGSYTLGSGSDLIDIVTHGTWDQPDGIANKTTREISVSNDLGRTLMQSVEVFTGSGYEQIQWQTQRYDTDGRLTDTFSSGNTHTHSDWNCCGKESETDAAGGTTFYTYDDLNRVLTTVQQGMDAGTYEAQKDIKTVYTYDAVGRVIQTTVLSGNLRQTTSSSYDGAGRLYTSTDTTGLQTTYDYSTDGLITTVTRPGGTTQTTTRHTDGRTQSITGSGTTAQYYTYGVNADGSQWTEVRIGAEDSPIYQRTITDMLGRTVLVEKPGPQEPEVTENEYDSQGRLIRTIQTGQADTLYVYDELGNAIQTGLDIDANGLLEPASTDRISGTDTQYSQINNQWWQQSTQQVYPYENDATVVTASVQRTQISGLIDDNEQSETISIDIHGNRTVSRTTIDRDARTQTQITDYPDSDIDARTISINGRVMETRSKTGLTTTFAYDSLGRRTSVTDPRTGTSMTHFDVKGRVDYVEDAAGHRTRFGYDDTTGRKISQTDALGKVTRFAYDDQGRTTHTWGDVPYPVRYEYDDYGRMTAMSTFRSDQGFDTVTFPESATGDTTLWHYDEATGLLSAKEYADGTQVTYVYTTGGRLDTRTWARQDNGQPLTTTYSYDPDTGELILIDYSDDTADISFVYDRLGRQSEINDALGTRTFIYNTGLQLESETINGLYNTMITRTYDQSNMIGRSTGFNLAGAYSITYGYDTTGRFNNLTWNAGGQIGIATYSRVPDSELLQTITYNNGQIATYGYEPNRNLKTRVQNNYGGQTISQYDYLYDDIGRRTSVATTGSAFAQAAFSAYTYNDRSELTGAHRYLGTDIADTTNPVNAEQRGYTYDPIGNRTQAQTAGVPTGYTANAVNQYTAVTEQTTYSPTYDPDGNLQNAPDGMHYTYNGENRLIAAQPETPVNGDTRVEFTYDYMGRRVQKIVYTYDTDNWSPITEYQYIYDGWNLIKQTTTPTGGSSVDKYYVWGLDLSQSLQGAGGVGGLVASVQGSLTTHYCYDANGNVTQLIDASDGSLAAHYEYDPFGNTVAAIGTMAGDNVYRFSTKYYDTEVNLYYYGYRYYSPEFGRWINRDPIGEKGGINLYLFISNDPIAQWDFLGLENSVVGTFLLEAKKIIYKDLVKIHFSEKDIFVEDLMGAQHLKLSPENQWNPEEYDGSGFPAEVQEGLDLRLTPTVNVEGDDVGNILLIFPVRSKWKLRITGKVNPDMDNCKCYEVDYDVTANLTFYDAEVKDGKLNILGAASGSKNEKGTLGKCKGKQLENTWPIKRDIKMPMMGLAPIIGGQLIKGSAQVSLTIRGYR